MAKKALDEKIKEMNKGHKIKIRYDKKSMQIYLDFFENYTRQRFYIKLPFTGNNSKDDYTLKLADEIRKRKEIELLNEKTGFKLSNNTKTDFRTYYQKILKDKNEKNYKNYFYGLERFLTFCKNDISIESITEKKIKDFQKFLENEKLSSVTIKDYISYIKIILNKAVDENIINKNPAKNIQLKTNDSIKIFLLEDELKAIKNTPFSHPEIKNAFLFSCFTGLRMSDLYNLKWDNIINNKLHIVQNKTGQISSINLSVTAKEIIKEQQNFKKTDNLVFHMLEANRSRNRIKELVIKAGINKNVGFHTARHTFACLCLSSGIDIYTVSKLLGHKDLKTTQVYAKLIDRNKDEAINKLPEI